MVPGTAQLLQTCRACWFTSRNRLTQQEVISLSFHCPHPPKQEVHSAERILVLYNVALSAVLLPSNTNHKGSE